MTRKQASFRSRYSDAVWARNALRPNEKLIALTFIKYAGAKDPKTKEPAPDDVAWVDWITLSDHTGIRSRDGINRAIRGLTDAGWIRQIAPARQHRSPRYKLLIPNDPGVRYTYVCDEQQP